MSEDTECICKGNWRAIVKKSEPLLNRLFIREYDKCEYRFFGIVHGSDDYYYGMIKHTDNSNLMLLSCVGNIESFGFTLKPRKPVFVFGSNLAGRHGAGSALAAVKHHGAIYGQGEGPQGDSYAIPTKDKDLKVLPLDVIHGFVHDFIHYANNNPDKEFIVVAIGCGLAGYTHGQIAPFFKYAPENVLLPYEWTAINNGVGYSVIDR